ncbi:MAG: transglycosylase family protein [Actinomycetota bacterium]|nr:transglycosylase family protein [Actinomycetota bacterium]
MALVLAALTPPRADAASTRAQRTIAQIDSFRTTTWRLQRLMGTKRTPTFFAERRTTNDAYRSWIRNRWKQRAARALSQAQKPPHRSQWQCIHRYERHPAQGWRTRTGNGYYGGLQMDIDFQRTYGPELLRRKGTADRWAPYEQMWVAERAHRTGRGFHPWPNTARYCGLI